MNLLWAAAWFTATLVLLLRPTLTIAGAADLEALIEKMENDVLDLAKAVESAYEDRCTTALDDCSRNNYDSCVSEFLSPTCYKSDEMKTNCSTSSTDTCAALFSFDASNVVLPSVIADGGDGNPTDAKVIESVCYTRQLDEYFIQKRQTDMEYWRNFGVESPTSFFGSQEGMFRIFPGRHFEKCGAFDPRVRPWYIAASSGPKNLILILDISASMLENQGQRFELAKQAAVRVIETLTVGDRVAIVPFSSSARVIGDSEGHMLPAISTNKEYLINAINDLEAVGGTNFYEALTSAFDTLDKTVMAELHNNCNTAILFMTDGEMTEPQGVTEQDVMNLLSARLNSTMQSTGGKPILFFTYSISSDESEQVHAFPKKLACSTELGVWSKIDDELKLFDSLTSYYRLFALGLGNKNTVSWVEPYKFATGGVIGTTVSSPVYDRSREPALFVGVVGMNFPLSAIDKALGLEAGNEAAINRIVKASTATCPTLNLTLCELESFRRQSLTGDESICNLTACSDGDFVQVEPIKCATVSDYPQDLWMNKNKRDKGYEDRVCCKVGETVPSDSCPAANPSKLAVGSIVLIIAGVIAFVFLLWWISCVFRFIGRSPEKMSIVDIPTSPNKKSGQEQVVNSCVAEHKTSLPPSSPFVMPPPSRMSETSVQSRKCEEQDRREILYDTQVASSDIPFASASIVPSADNTTNTHMF